MCAKMGAKNVRENVRGKCAQKMCAKMWGPFTGANASVGLNVCFFATAYYHVIATKPALMCVLPASAKKIKRFAFGFWTFGL